MAQDVVVTIDARKPAPLIGLGKPLILAQKTGPSSFRNYSTIDAVKVDFAEGTPAYKKAFALLGQNTKPASIAIATYDSAATVGEPKTAAEAIAKYYYHDWFFLLLTSDVQTEQIAVGDYVEAKKSKMLVVKTATTAARDAIKEKDYKYVINFYHTVADEMPDAALVGELGSKTVGSITWKFKALTGITPLELGDELDEVHAAGAIAYVRKNGRAETSEGITVSGDYIDNVHGEQWVILEISKNVQNLFSQTDKVPYDHRGIEMIAGVTRTALKFGHTNGIVAEDDANNPIYTVSTIPRSESPAADRGARIYNGVSFYFEAAGAIHGAGIKGEVVY